MERSQGQLLSITREADNLNAQLREALEISTRADAGTKQIRANIIAAQNRNLNSSCFINGNPCNASADSISLAIKMECTNEEASVTDLQIMLTAALRELPRLQTVYAQRLRQLRLDAETATSDRIAFSSASARLHALSVEIIPHVAMLTHLLQEERKQGVAMKQDIGAAMDAAMSWKLRTLNARHAPPTSASPLTTRQCMHGQENMGSTHNHFRQVVKRQCKAEFLCSAPFVTTQPCVDQRAE